MPQTMPPTRYTGGWARRTAATLTLLSATLLGSTPLAVAATKPPSYPYVPTQILLAGPCAGGDAACHGRDAAYVFSQGDDGGVQFLRMNYSKAVAGSDQLETVTKGTLPFLQNVGGTSTFGASRTGNGTVMVYTGKCDGTAGQVWSYSDRDGADWTHITTLEDANTNSHGPSFLGGTIAFSSTLAPKMDQPTLYTYGGMCLSPEASSQDWQSSANYTKTMLSIKPSGDQLDALYDIGLASQSGPRSAMAGFTMTGLTPAVSNVSGTVTQQASYVVLGGHTQQAFINMSTAAVWHLPEESWSYVSIQAPDNTGPAKNGGELLAAKDSLKRALPENVYSRSGHTAVLSHDGSSIVVLGGWVGDVGTPAEPQLAVLEMSQAYSSWQWKIPAQPDGDGIYGHGAALLPGNVMAIYGGWEISSTASKRRAVSASTRFLNLTSMEWGTDYTNPQSQKGSTKHPDAPAATGKSSSSKKSKLGMGLGLGLGLGLALLLVILVLFFFWRRQKARKQTAARDIAARALAQDAAHFTHDTSEMAERDDFFPWGIGNGWYTGGQDAYQTGDRSMGYESVRSSEDQATGAYAVVNRKPVSRQLRGGYMPADSRMSNFSSQPGQIHPIMEDDEEDRPYETSLHNNNYNYNEPHTPISEVHSDPFATPTGTTATATLPAPLMMHPIRSAATPSPEGLRRTDPDVQDWVSDVDAADALLTKLNNSRPGRTSPTRRNSRGSALRDDESRSGSNLSESNRSAADSLWGSASGRKQLSIGGAVSPFGMIEKPGSSSSSSYNTARSGFAALQAEAPTLLGRATPSSPLYEEDETPGSPSKSKPRRNWLGSLRRVFSNSESTTPTNSTREDSPQRPSMDQASGDYEAPLVGLSGELLKRKQGRHDWEDGAENNGNADNRGTIPTTDSDWDIERAVEKRLVQVMFTVPKERLRVVNGDDMDEGDIGDAKIGEDNGLHRAHTAEIVNPSTSVSSQHTASLDELSEERGRLRQRELERELQEERDERERQMHRQHDHEQQHDLHPHYHHHQDKEDSLLHVDFEDSRLSHSTDGSGARSTAAVFTAEAVTLTLARPYMKPTKVLQMVDSIENRSQSDRSHSDRSQSGSPSRTKFHR